MVVAALEDNVTRFGCAGGFEFVFHGERVGGGFDTVLCEHPGDVAGAVPGFIVFATPNVGASDTGFRGLNNGGLGFVVAGGCGGFGVGATGCLVVDGDSIVVGWSLLWCGGCSGRLWRIGWWGGFLWCVSVWCGFWGGCVTVGDVPWGWLWWCFYDGCGVFGDSWFEAEFFGAFSVKFFGCFLWCFGCVGVSCVWLCVLRECWCETGGGWWCGVF